VRSWRILPLNDLSWLSLPCLCRRIWYIPRKQLIAIVYVGVVCASVAGRVGIVAARGFFAFSRLANLAHKPWLSVANEYRYS